MSRVSVPGMPGVLSVLVVPVLVLRAVLRFGRGFAGVLGFAGALGFATALAGVTGVAGFVGFVGFGVVVFFAINP